MGSKKSLVKKLKLIAVSKRSVPRWCDIKKFGLKRARTRRIRANTKNWRRNKYKV
jgi:ribosomal protein L39E